MDDADEDEAAVVEDGAGGRGGRERGRGGRGSGVARCGTRQERTRVTRATTVGGAAQWRGSGLRKVGDMRGGEVGGEDDCDTASAKRSSSGRGESGVELDGWARWMPRAGIDGTRSIGMIGWEVEYVRGRGRRGGGRGSVRAVGGGLRYKVGRQVRVGAAALELGGASLHGAQALGCVVTISKRL